MHRLFYLHATLPFGISSTTSSNSSNSSNSNSNNDDDDDDEMIFNWKKILKALPNTFIEPIQWPGLMVTFGKALYPEYECIYQATIFKTKELYLCYEIAWRLQRTMEMILQVFQNTDVGFFQEQKEQELHIEWIILEETSPKLFAFQNLIKKKWEPWECLQQLKTFLAQDCKTFDMFVLEIKKCLQVYLRFTTLQFTVSRNSNCYSDKLPLFLQRFTAGHVLCDILHDAACLYERQRRYQLANLLLNTLLDTFFYQRRRGKWWNRLALNFEHLKQPLQAISCCQNGLEDPKMRLLEADRLSLSKRLQRLLKKHPSKPTVVTAVATGGGVINLISDDEEEEEEEDVEEEQKEQKEQKEQEEEEEEVNMSLKKCPQYPETFIRGRPLNRTMGQKSRLIGFDEEPCTVEQYVLQYFGLYEEIEEEEMVELVLDEKKKKKKSGGDGGGGGGWYGSHCEGSVLRTLFGLLMWDDVLFKSIPDVFQTPFQDGPLDFGLVPHFYTVRQVEIETRLETISAMNKKTLIETIGLTWRQQYGRKCRFVDWQSFPLKYLQLVAIAMTPQKMALFCRHVITSSHRYGISGGLPDLLLVRLEAFALKDNTCSFMKMLRENFLNEQAQTIDLHRYCGFFTHLNLNGKQQEKEENYVDPDKEKFVGFLMDDENTAPRGITEQEQDQTNKKHEDLIWTQELDVELLLVEVKGPRDRLSDTQLIWLEKLKAMQIQVQVVHVVEEEKTLLARRQRKKKQQEPSLEPHTNKKKKQKY
jgi:hypothetical protein